MTEEHIETQEQKAAGGPSPALLVLVLLPLFGILAALAMVVANLPQSPDYDDIPLGRAETEGLTATLIGRTAPDFELTDLDGQPVRLSDLRGRAVLLNFWQTTCAPCVREMPAFEEFAQFQGPQGTAVLAVSFSETADMVRDFLNDLGVSGVPVALDPDAVVRRQYSVQGIPMTFVIDAEGVVRYVKLGEMTVDEMEVYSALVNEEPQPDL